MGDIDILHEHGHYVVYIHGKFFCSADTYSEAVKELQDEGVLQYEN